MKLSIKTKGHYDFINITNKISKIIKNAHIKSGLANIFVTGTTVSIIVMEYEKGIISDLINISEKLAPENAHYEHHNKKCPDKNGAAHIKSVLLGSNITVPIQNSKLQLGTWQQIVLIDFDEKPIVRNVIIKIVKSKI